MSIAASVPPKRRFDLSWPILIGFAAGLCALIVLPMSWLVFYSFPDKGRFTLENFVKLATDPTFTAPLITTVIIATSSAFICCAGAAAMGWLRASAATAPRRAGRPLGPA